MMLGGILSFLLLIAVALTLAYGQETSIQGKNVIVTAILTEPFCMETGRGSYEGYSVDLMTELSTMLNFNYKMRIVADGKYGSYYNASKTWNGMMKEIIDKKADFAVADLTINKERADNIDFSFPFMNFGVSILYKIGSKQAPSIFAFLHPFSVHVWVYSALAFVAVAVLLFIIARFSPCEWKATDGNNELLTNEFTFSNAFFFAIGSLLWQGSNITPRAVSTRVLSAFWWFFTVVLVCSYTANMAAFLITSSNTRVIPFTSAEELIKTSSIKIGAVRGGSTSQFLQNAAKYTEAWNRMEKEGSFSSSNAEGVERVLKSKDAYAFFMESATLEYVVAKHCDLTQVGDLLNSKSYGVAMQKNSPYREAINGAILKLQDSGKLSELKQKWWNQGNQHCQTNSGGPDSLRWIDLSGVFLLLIFGAVLSCIIAAVEFVWIRKNSKEQQRIPVYRAMAQELGQVLRSGSSSKPTTTSAAEIEEEKNELGAKEAVNGKEVATA